MKAIVGVVDVVCVATAALASSIVLHDRRPLEQTSFRWLALISLPAWIGAIAHSGLYRSRAGAACGSMW